jgi:hypothetical protein
VSAYNLPVRRKLELSRTRPLSTIYDRSSSSSRTRILESGSSWSKLRNGCLEIRLKGWAADILTVADVYSLPLEFVLGIGAMENNYMDVRGDFSHTIWKRKPAPDDVVLERRRGRVRIVNDSDGVWQKKTNGTTAFFPSISVLRKNCVSARLDHSC